MLNRRATLLIALVVVLLAFAWGVIHLFNLRFASGDVYPPYSSFRADPLGARVYFESLEQLGQPSVRRFIQPITRLPEGRGVTLFVFGLPWSEMSAEQEEYRILDGFVRNGGRLVVTLYPELGRPRAFSSGTGTNRPTFKNPLLDDDERHPPINLREKWDFGYEYISTTRDSRLLTPVKVHRIDPGPLPEAMNWHSALVFTNLGLDWKVIYARGSDPVMIERQLDKGSIVVASDSYFVSNEALRKERSADLLAWLSGTSHEVIFNETHLGVQEQPGIATLARRYKLHGGFAALLALAALFIWKSSASFVPHAPDPAENGVELGRESAAGFENLLRRSVPAKDLLQTSLDEWDKTANLDARITPPRREKIRAIVESFNASPKPNAIDAYREITRILNRKK